MQRVVRVRNWIFFSAPVIKMNFIFLVIHFSEVDQSHMNFKGGSIYNEAVPRTCGPIQPIPCLCLLHPQLWPQLLLVMVLAASQPRREPCMTHKLYRLLLSRESLLTDLGCQFRKQESLASSHPREPVLWTQIRCSGFDT